MILDQLTDVVISAFVLHWEARDKRKTNNCNRCDCYQQHYPPPDFCRLMSSVGHGRRMRLARCRELKREIDQSLFAQINFAEINVRCDFANLVTYPVRHQ